MIAFDDTVGAGAAVIAVTVIAYCVVLLLAVWAQNDYYLPKVRAGDCVRACVCASATFG